MFDGVAAPEGSPAVLAITSPSNAAASHIVVVTSPNVILASLAKAIKSTLITSEPAALARMESWLAFDTHTLAPAIYDRNTTNVKSALKQIDDALAKSKTLAGTPEATVADIAIFCTLLTTPEDVVQEYANVKAFMASMAKHKAIVGGTKQWDALPGANKQATPKPAPPTSIPAPPPPPTPKPLPPMVAATSSSSSSSEGNKKDKKDKKAPATLENSTTATTESKKESKKAKKDKNAPPAISLSKRGRLPDPCAGATGKIRPVANKKNVLITSALPYVNNVPHLGNIIGCVLSADCYARYRRLRGDQVLYVCGTDEYGTATETKALEEKLTPRQICDKYHVIHKEVYDWFDIAFDHFGRTSEPEQKEVCQALFKTIHNNGYTYEKTIDQLYSPALNKFLADRFVVGTCPKCKYDDARGDQCDKCGALLNPTELINPKCKMSGATPVLKSTTHIFLDLPKVQEKLRVYIDKASASGGWSDNCVGITEAWMKKGLQARCITRDLTWGVPVPLKGFEHKVFYVWFDAPIGYISMTKAYCEEHWKEWWQSGKGRAFLEGSASSSSSGENGNLEYVEFMGKDNVPFHTVMFPSCLLAAHPEPWTLMNKISVTEYLNYEDTKFSKSRGVGVFGTDARDTNIISSAWRFYLLSVRPETEDAQFRWPDFQARLNNELLANVGNFCLRALKFTEARFEGKVPKWSGKGLKEIEEFGKDAKKEIAGYIEHMDKMQLREGLKKAMLYSKLANQFFQSTAPWVKVKEDVEMCGDYILAALGIVRVLAALLCPFMPQVTAALLQQLNLKDGSGGKSADKPSVHSAILLTSELLDGAIAPHTLMPQGAPISSDLFPLFEELTDDMVETFRERFGGSQAEREEKAAKAKDKKSGGDAKATAPAPAPKKGGAPAAKAAAGPLDVSRVMIKVGTITEVGKHPDADALYVEKIDLGEEGGPRTVVSGLVKHYSLEEMQNRRVLVVCNLKPAKMRGVESQGMVLCGTGEDGKVEFIEPPEGVPNGERVLFPGYTDVDGVPEPESPFMPPKKKMWEAVQPDFATDGACIAKYKDVAFTTSKGPCKSKSVKNAGIK